MTKFLIYFTVSCALFLYVSSVPVTEEKTTQDLYEQRIKLLTGSTTPPTCHQNNGDFNGCIKRLFELIQPRLAAGIPELNIPPSEPLKLNSTVFRFNLGAASGRLQMKNAAIYGISTYQIKKLDLKEENGIIKYDGELFIPKMNIIGNYKATVTLNKQFNFKPHGAFNLTLHDVTISMSSEGKLFEKDGHKFEQLYKIDAEPKIGKMDIDITGIFEDPDLNEFALNVGKEYWREVYKVMLPETRDYWEPLLLRTMNEVLSLLPFDAFVQND